MSTEVTTDETVRLSVPASLEYVRVARLTASAVASRLGFDVEEIENLRVAVDELVSLVIDVAAGGSLDVTFRTVDGALRIDGRVPIRTGADVGVEDLTAQILKAVTDEYDLRANDGYAEFTCARQIPTISG